MVNFDQAKEAAKKCWPEIDYVAEYPRSFSFSKFDDNSIGGICYGCV